ncbi:MAG: tetratricopeptide repeat protein [Rhodospirillales bacterium]
MLGRHDEAVAIGGRGVRANPSDAASRATYGEILSMAGAHAAGAAELRLAISLNPYHPPFWTAPLGRALLLAGQAGEALTELQRCAALAPDYRPCPLLVGRGVHRNRGSGGRARGAAAGAPLWPGLARGNYDAAFEFRNQSGHRPLPGGVPCGGRGAGPGRDGRRLIPTALNF